LAKKGGRPTAPAARPDAADGVQVLAVRGGSVEDKKWKTFAAFDVVPGSKLNVELKRRKGDPDLFVRFNQKPTLNAWDCRPLVRGRPGHERCELQVPQGASTAHIRVRGHGRRTSRFDLSAAVQASQEATVHPVATAFAQSFVAALLRCQSNPDRGFINQIEPGGSLWNVADVGSTIIAPMIDAVIDLGGAIPHEDRLAPCLAYLENLSCDGTEGVFGNAFPEACRGALEPTRAVGGSCMTPMECATGFCDTSLPPGAEPPADGIECGRCAPVPEPRPQSCIDLGCPDGLVCVANDETYSTYECVPPAGIGERCELVPCAPDLLCGSQPDAGQFCRQPPQQGEPCLDVGTCQGPDLVCDFQGTGLCVPVPRLGEPCSFRCVDGATCSQQSSVCVPTPREGEPCPEFECAGGAECVRSPNALDGVVGTCVMVLRGQQEGDRCTPLPFGEPSCGEPTLFGGLACAGEPGAEVCTRAVVVGDGEVCDVRQSNMQGSRYCLHQFTTKACVFASPTDRSGVCGPRSTVGDACGADLPCDIKSATCSWPSFSEEPPPEAPPPEAGVCIAFANQGQSCNRAQCAPGLQCDYDMTPEPVCKPMSEVSGSPIRTLAQCLAR
jgi:hypothetical protein